MALSNPWVGYITRSYIQIKIELLNRLGTATPEITDHSSSNIMIVILDIFAGLVEMLNYYIDNMAREAFISTARKYSSMIKHARLIDYRVKAAIPSKVDLSISFFDASGDPYQVAAFTLPQGTIFSTGNGTEFISIDAIDVIDNAISMIVPCSQETQIVNQLLGITTPDLNQTATLGSDYAHDTIDLKVGGVVWILKNTLGRSTPTDKHYIVDVSVDKVAFIQFGDGVNGVIPTAGQELRGDYSTTKGEVGNVVQASINSTTYDFTTHGIDNVVITNNFEAVAGSDYEGIEKIRRSAPLSLRTLERAVTNQDFIDVTKLAPGVDKANIDFVCGKVFSIYIIPNGGGIAPQSLLDDTQAFLDLRKMATTFPVILPTGQSDVIVDMDIKARFRASITQTQQDIIDVLTANYSYDTSDVNKPIRTSDIIALVDNLEKVDYLTLNRIYLSPYFRPTESSTPEMLKTFSVNIGSTQKLNWEIKSDGTNLTLFKEGNQIATIPLSTTYTDPDNILTINVQPNSYTAGMVWEFTTYPYNSNIELDNFSIPIISSSNIFLNITETLTL